MMTWSDSNGPYYVWDAETGKELYVLTSQSDRWSGSFPKFLPDSKKIRMMDGVGGPTGADTKVRFFDAETGEELTLPGKYNGWSPDGKRRFSWGDGEVHIWDDESGKKLFTLPETFGGWSPDGRMLTWNEGITHIWDAESGKELYKLTGVYVKFSPEGKKIVTRSFDVGNETDDETIWTYDAETYEELYALMGRYVGFTRDGKTIVTSAKDGNTRIWDDEFGKEFAIPGRYVDSSLDGKRIVTSGNGTGVWDVESRRELFLAQGSFEYFLPGEKTIVTSVLAYDEQDMSYEINHVYNAETGKELVLTGAYIGFSPDGKKIVSTSGNNTHIWDAETGKELYVLVGRVYSWLGGFSSDGKRVITQSDDKTYIWDSESGKELHVLPGRSYGFTPDGRFITTLEDHSIRIWTLE